MKDGAFKWDIKGLKHVDSQMANALAKSAYVLQDDIREEQVIPRKVGTLQGEAFYVHTDTAKRGYVTLGFNTPYARRLYFHPEYHFHREAWVDTDGKTYEGNPNAQGEWLRHWLKGGKYQNRFKQIYEGILKL